MLGWKRTILVSYGRSNFTSSADSPIIPQMKPFFSEDFLLQNDVARELYHDYAAPQPIYDYHCHVPPDQIAANKTFRNIAEVWLGGDHYKWRAMRTNGV